MAIEAVIFDWGGTLTPWHTIAFDEEWRSVAQVAAPHDVDATTQRLLGAAAAVWSRARDDHGSGTFEEVCRLAGILINAEHSAAYRAFWEPATYTDPQVEPLLVRLRANGLKIGVLSNTIWPREWHRKIFERDRIDHLIHGDIYTSEIPWTKPDPRAFRAVMEAVGVVDPARCVFVGDRIFDDIFGANQAGMKSVFLPHSVVPSDQIARRGTPDAVVSELTEVYDVVSGWQA
jgi:putative hydrolase of the HAD superfamily